MKIRKITRLVALLIIFCLFLGIRVYAAGPQSTDGMMATDSFSFSVQGQSYRKDSTAISFEAGESVTVKGSVSLFSANVKYGFVSSDGTFYGVPAENGVLNYTFTIGVRGIYYFTVINYSSVPINVSGYINY